MLFKSPVAFLFSLAITMSASSAVPVVFNSIWERDVWAPRVTSPSATTVWECLSNQTVTWDTSNAPANVTNPIGTLLLGFINPDNSGGENLDVDHPLAQGFPLTAGSAEITVPVVPTKVNYIVVLIGDSGDASERFRINCQAY
jgi:hypothetical protein